MKHAATALIAALALAIAVGGYCWWGVYQELIEARAAAAKLESIASLRDQLWKAQAQIKSLTARLARANGQGGADGDAGPGDNLRGPGGQPLNGMALFAKLMRDPEFRRLQGIQLSVWFDQNFGGLVKRLNLTPDQAARFKALALERMQVGQDAASAAIDQGMDMNKDRAEIGQIIKQSTDDVDTQIKALIGDSGWSASKDYVGSMQQRLEASQLQTSLSYTPNPMSNDQVQQLAQAISGNPVKKDPNAVVAVTGYATPQPVLMNGQSAGVAGPQGGVQAVPAISDDAINAATGFLSQPQIAALRQMQQVQQSQQQLGQIMKAQQAGSSTGGK